MAIAITGIGISLGAVVGLVTVFGISARNAILQLAHYEHLVEVEGGTWDVALVIRGANERFVPILMTAAVTALGLAPLAFGLNAKRNQSRLDPFPALACEPRTPVRHTRVFRKFRFMLSVGLAE